MFRFLSRLFMALAALFMLRLLFATARRVNQRGDAGRVPPSPSPGAAGERNGARRPARPPRIDAARAEDVPFVEVGAERERVPRG
ncbi:MAG TPA: hypothetical protein VFU59_00570 [Candidatus Eisenbacteria bacterium]|nr:hypothetical protein [Candidatus Eisenbacteria bacterium]